VKGGKTGTGGRECRGGMETQEAEALRTTAALVLDPTQVDTRRQAKAEVKRRKAKPEVPGRAARWRGDAPRQE
jgi:hypothetical protein